MQASCKQNIYDSFEILGLINFVHVVHQIGGVLFNPLPLNMVGSLEHTGYDHFPLLHGNTCQTDRTDSF